MMVAMIAALLAGWHWSARSLRAYVADHRAADVTVEQIQLAAAPPWMSILLKEQLQSVVAREIDANPLDGSGLRRAAESLKANAWVRSVHRLERRPAGEVVVEATYRRPIALIRSRDGFRPVDAQGVRLPGLYLSHQVSLVKLPVVDRVAAGPSRPGEVWPGQDVQAAMRLIVLLRGESYMDQVQTFDVGQRDSRGRLRITMRTHGGGQVVWGLPPGSEGAVEPDAATKKHRLASVDRRRGRIDAGGKIVDLSGAAVFVHQQAGHETARNIDYTW